MDNQGFDHFFPDPRIFGASEEYKARRQRGTESPGRERTSHADHLLNEYRQVVELIQKDRQSRLDPSLPEMGSIQIEFVGAEKSQLAVAELEGRSQGIYLLNVRSEGSPPIQTATVHVSNIRGRPNAFFTEKIGLYRNADSKSGKPRYDQLMRSIESIRPATLSSFWFGGDVDLPDKKTEIWCEIWLTRPGEPPKSRKKRIKTNSTKSEDGSNAPSGTATRFRHNCRQLGIDCRPRTLRFPEQEVFLVRANGIQLQGLVDSVEMLSAICPYREPASFFLNLLPREQPEWIEDMVARLSVSSTPTSSVCVLDTGVNSGHPLLSPVISDKHRHSVKMDNDVADFRNPRMAHGTEMCGIAAFGDLSEALESPHPLSVDHAVESVKILFEGKEDLPELFGQITTRAVSLAETAEPNFNRVSCLAVSSEGTIDGTPSSWSASIDQLAFGEEIEDDMEAERPSNHKRLLVVSAGNVREPADWVDYPTSNTTTAIEDPAQAWNALTVGAFTDKTTVTETGTEGYTAVAPRGALSPLSRTSQSWDYRWPLKPDIVLEGGNVAKDSKGNTADFESLAVLTTAPDWAERGIHFSPFRGTSPATAQASWMAAKIFTACPQAWPETVRGLLVHSARWTDVMNSSKGNMRKDEVRQIIRTVGYGVPNLARALRSARNSFTMIFQDDQLQPFVKKGSTLSYNHIRLFELPWPRNVLQELDNTPAEIRITLSYFIAPKPGQKGWNNRYRYPSHALRFDLNNIGEDRATFLQRLSAKEEGDGDTEESEDRDSGSARWLVGQKLRSRGSIHTDVWSGAAVDMVNCRYLAVYPGGGWWKERHQSNYGERSVRFSLLVSLEVPEATTLHGVPVDLYTPVRQEIIEKTQVDVPILTTLPVGIR